jgi:hypothetical protein
LLSIGKRIFGLVQLSGLNLVARPPARIKAFKRFPPFARLQTYIRSGFIKTIAKGVVFEISA